MSKRLPELRIGALTGAIAICAVLLVPTRGETATELRWMQPGGSSPQGFKIYFGNAPDTYTGYRDIGYVTPDSEGVFSYPLQGVISEPSYVSMTAYNAAGESAFADEIFINPICSVDADCAVFQQCKTGTCNQTLGCVTQNLPDGTACDDGDANTTGDHCSAGQCVNTSPPGVGGSVDITQIVAGTSTGTVGKPVGFAAVATSSGTPLFRWLVMPLTSGNWIMLRDYDPNPLFAWTPQNPGEYRVAVSARTSGATEEQDWHAIDFQVAAAPVQPPAPPSDPVAFDVQTADPAGQVPWNVPITLEARGGEGLEYRFLLFRNGRPRRLLRNYSSDPSFLWSPRFRPGIYEIGVEVRNAGERRPFGYDTSLIEIVRAPLLECSPSGATVQCSTPPSTGELEYRWSVRAPRSRRWEVLHDYGEMGDSIAFTPSAGSGTYHVAIDAKSPRDSRLRGRLVYRKRIRVEY